MLDSPSFIVGHPERSGPVVLPGLKIILWHCGLIKGPADINMLSEKCTRSVQLPEINGTLSLIFHPSRTRSMMSANSDRLTRLTDFSRLLQLLHNALESRSVWTKPGVVFLSKLSTFAVSDWSHWVFMILWVTMQRWSTKQRRLF